MEAEYTRAKNEQRLAVMVPFEPEDGSELLFNL